MECCFLCPSPASLGCSACPTKSCSPAHLAQHRPSSSCRPFTIHTVPGVGRCLLASRPILPGEEVLAEQAAVVGPNQQGRPLCLACLRPADLSFLCPSCSFPFCDQACLQGAEELHAAECEVLSRAPAPDLGPGSSAHHAILPLRLLLFLEHHPDQAKLVTRLMTHAEEKASKDYWPVSQVHVVDFLLEQCDQAARWSRDQVTDAVTLLEVNGFEIESYPGGGFRGLYPSLASLTSHSCTPNCLSVVDTCPPYTNR